MLRNCPVEGSALMAHRQESSTQRALDAQQAQEQRTQAVARGEFTQSAPVTLGTAPKPKEAAAAIKDRKKHLKDMQNLRTNMVL